MTTLLICLGALLTLAAIGYLAACAGAERWLPMREWLAQTSCRHSQGVLVAIEFDGEAVYRCTGCGKHIRRPL